MNVEEYFLEKGYLLSPDFLESVKEDFDKDGFMLLLKEKVNGDVLVLNKDIFSGVLNGGNLDVNWKKFDLARVDLEKGRGDEGYRTFMEIVHYDEHKEEVKEILEEVKVEEEVIIEEEENGANVVVLKNYGEDPKKRELKDFVAYFKIRYEALSGILKSREELRDVMSINRLKGKESNDAVSLIGLVVSKRATKKGDYIFTIEDISGSVPVWFSKDVEDVKDVCLDECIGVIGSMSERDLVFGKQLLLPDVPITKEMKRCEDDVNVAFISDAHVGSKLFFRENFEKMIKWLKLEEGEKEQLELARKVKYLFIGGDLVEGIGLYADHDKDCEIKDVYKQYEEFTKLIKNVPSHIKIIICPGNHDALRIDEPQPAIGKDLANDLNEMENVYMVSNPGLVRIHSSKDFDGFDVLLYHGMSFPYYAENVESIRMSGGIKRSDLIMKYLMKRRHLAPTHTAVSYIPDNEKDCLVIDKVPDFLLTGHIHRCSVDSYNNVTLINASCWVGQSDLQEKMGLVPEPGRVVVANLRTRDVKILKFLEDG